MVSAFTQGDIDTSIYLEPNKALIDLFIDLGIISKKDRDILLRLNKALYGLKQSARIWYNTLANILINKLGFTPLKSEPCIFINKSLNIIICLYVDDLAIVCPNIAIINTFINNIKEYFDIKVLGPIKDYLGIEIDYDLEAGTMKLVQTKYIEKLVVKFNQLNLLPIYIPLDPKIKLEPNRELASKEDIKLFQQIIGSILYVTLGTRPDVAYSTIKLSRFASNPSKEHIKLALRIIRYLYTTRDIGLLYSSKRDVVDGYCDSDYAGDTNSGKSTSGYIFYLANGPISWKSKLQSVIAQSTTEAEFIAINLASKEAIYIIHLLKELGYYKQSIFPLYTDNNGALLLAKNPVFHERTKHINVKYYYIRDLIETQTIDLLYINTIE